MPPLTKPSCAACSPRKLTGRRRRGRRSATRTTRSGCLASSGGCPTWRHHHRRFIEDPDLNKKLLAPQLIRAISLGTPNKRIGDHTIALLDSLEARGYELTRSSFDRGYSQLTDAFHDELSDGASLS